MDAYIDAYVVRGTVDSDEIDLYGACDHFFSLEHAKLLKDCASVAEFNLKKEIFGIELDPLLLTEIKDGFNECEIATPKMVEYAIRIHNVLYHHLYLLVDKQPQLPGMSLCYLQSYIQYCS